MPAGIVRKEFFMKNPTKFFGIIAIMAVIMCSSGSCVSVSSSDIKITDVFDESIPEDQRAKLIIPGRDYDVFEFSGRQVEWFNLKLFDIRGVHIPSGEHTLKFYYYPEGDKKHSSQILKLTANYEAGKAYILARKAGPIFDTFHIQDIETKRYVEK
jgi:hypothetical protein